MPYRKKISIIDLLIFLFCVSVYIFALETRFTIIFRGITIILLVALLVYAGQNRVSVDSYGIAFLSFLLFCVLSIMWSKNPARSFSQCIRIFEIFITIILLSNYIRKENKLKFFVFSMTCATWIYSVYILSFYGISNFIRLVQMSERVGEELTNVNTIGVCTAMGAILTLWYVLFEKRKIYIIPMLLCSIIAISTASKKVIICLVVGFFVLYTMKTNDKKKLAKLLAVPVAIIVIYYVLQLPIFDTVLNRIDRFIWTFNGQGRGDGSTQTRLYYIQIGFQEFLKRPLWGVGIGCSNWITANYVGKATYLHNNYIELLASVGLFGTLIFYSMYFIPIRRMLRGGIKRNKYSVLAFCIIMLRLFMHIAMVEYYDKIEYLFLLLVYLLVENSQELNGGEDQHIINS